MSSTEPDPESTSERKENKKKFERNHRNRDQHSHSSKGGAPKSAFMLTPGQWLNWSKKFGLTAAQEYGALATLCENDAYPTLVKPDISDFGDMSDALGVNKILYLEACKANLKEEMLRKSKWVSLFAFMMERMSEISEELVRLDSGFAQANTDKDPLALWKILRATHASASSTRVKPFNLLEVRQTYTKIAQGRYETLIAFKTRFDAALAAYNELHTDLEEPHTAMDYLDALCPDRYHAFKTEYINDLVMESVTEIKTLASMHARASSYVVSAGVRHPNISGSVYAATIERNHRAGQRDRDTEGRGDRGRGRGDRGRGRGPNTGGRGRGGRTSTPDTAETPQETTVPDDDNDNNHSDFYLQSYSPTGTTQYATINASVNTDHHTMPWYMVRLDNQADVSAIMPRLLQDIHPADHTLEVTGINGGQLSINERGTLPGLFELYCSDKLSANILAIDDMETRYHITYVPGEHFTAHTPCGDLVFKKIDKCYFADLRNWPRSKSKSGTALVTTVDQVKCLYSKSDVAKADQARALYLATDTPSQDVFIRMLTSGCIDKTTVQPADFKRAMHIYGPERSFIKGHATKNKHSHYIGDPTLRPQLVDLDVWGDIMAMRGIPYLLTVSTPLNLLQISPLASQQAEDIGPALQDQVNALRSQGFRPANVFVDPQSSMRVLKGKFPDINIDIGGTGTKLPPLDIRMRHVKDLIRGRTSLLPWKLPKQLLFDIGAYAVSRLNCRPSTSSTSPLPAITKFTGLRPSAKHEFDLEFGDYCQVYAEKGISNDIDATRSIDVIACYPNSNRSKSWTFLNLQTLKRLTRPSWTKMRTTGVVIDRMNQIAAADIANLHVPLFDDDLLLDANPQPIPRPAGPPLNYVIPPQYRDEQFLLDAKPIENKSKKFLPPDSTSLSVPTTSLSVPTCLIPESTSNPVENNENDKTITDSMDLNDHLPSDCYDSDDSDCDSYDDELSITPVEIREENEVPNVPNSPPADSAPPSADSVPPTTPREDYIDYRGILTRLNTTPSKIPVRINPNLRHAERVNYRALAGFKQSKRSNTKLGTILSIVITEELKKNNLDHMTVKKGTKLFGESAHDSAWKELRQLFVEKDVMIPILRSDLSYDQLKSIIRCSMFLKAKFDAQGIFEKLKARLVAWGHTQDRNLYPNRSSPTVALQNLMMVLTQAAKEGREVAVGDIGGAYLTCDLTGELVVIELDDVLTSILAKRLPEIIPYVDKRGRLLAKLDKALYGLVQSSRIWYDKLSAILIDLGYTPNPLDPCVYNKVVNGKQITLCVFVDDVLATCVDRSTLDKFHAELRTKFDDLKFSISNDISYIGMRIRILEGKIVLTMDGYVKDLLDKWPDIKEYTSPATKALFDNDPNSPQLCKKDSELFHTTTAKLLYLTLRAKPAIGVAVSHLVTRVTRSTVQDMDKLKRVIGYLKHTAIDGVVLHGDGELRISAYVDAAFGPHEDGKSHTGGLFFFGTALIYAKSTKQSSMTAKDSTEAELIAASDKLNDIMSCHEFLVHQGIAMLKPILYQDNQSAIHWMTTGLGEIRTKHLRVRKFRVKEYVDNDSITVTYVKTDIMKADLLTKPLQGSLFRTHVSDICGTDRCDISQL